MRGSTLFPLGGPVPEEDVVDREDFLNSLTTRLLEGQNIILAGPRRIGKTSLVLEVLRRLKRAGCYTLFVDLFRISTKRELAEAIINACLENTMGTKGALEKALHYIKGTSGPAGLNLKLGSFGVDIRFPGKAQDADALLDRAFDLPERLAEKHKRQVVVAFDEFQEAPRVGGEDIFKKMRSYFQMHRNVSYLFLGSKEDLMKAIFSGSKQAFYRFALALPIPPIPKGSWVEYIAKKFHSAGVKADEGSIEEIVRLTGGHPQDTMLVCSETYHFLLEASEKTLTLEAVRIGYERAFGMLAPLYDRMLDEIGVNSRSLKVLKKLAKGEKIYNTKEAHPNEVRRALGVLVSKGIIQKGGRGKYEFSEPMFKEYVLREFLFPHHV